MAAPHKIVDSQYNNVPTSVLLTSVRALRALIDLTRLREKRRIASITSDTPAFDESSCGGFELTQTTLTSLLAVLGWQDRKDIDKFTVDDFMSLLLAKHVAEQLWLVREPIVNARVFQHHVTVTVERPRPKPTKVAKKVMEQWQQSTVTNGDAHRLTRDPQRSKLIEKRKQRISQNIF